MRRFPERPSGSHTGWSPTRNRGKQAAFRKGLIERSDGQCEFVAYTMTGDGVIAERCQRRSWLRAAHITPLSQGGSYDLANGLMLCPIHDRETDRYAR